MSRGLTEPIMSGDENLESQSPVPVEGAVPVWLGFSIAVDFYPAIKMTRKGGLQFTAELAEHLEPENVHLEGDEWRIDGGGVYEGIKVTVTKTRVQSFTGGPSNKLEWYEHRTSAILRAFEQVFEPKVALQTNVKMSALVSLPEGVDARAFLGGYVMLMNPKRLAVIGRQGPEVLGIRLFFPPCKGQDWTVNVRVESFGPNPNKVFLQADADWDDQAMWDEKFADHAVTRITTVSRFMQGPLVDFLRYPPAQGVSEEEDE
jgi:hypothetical protein